MLILQRKVGQKIMLGDGIVIEVVAAGNGRTRIAIDAPANVTIRRSEVDRSQRTMDAQTTLINASENAGETCCDRRSSSNE